MQHDELERIFAQTLDDRRLSRTERQALSELISDLALGTEDRAAYLNRAFAAAEASLSRHADREVLDWLLAVAKIVTLSDAPAADTSSAIQAEAVFEPEQNCAGRLKSLISESVSSLDVCVFTITDDSLSEALREAHRRGLKVRIITDDMKSLDLGSDIADLQQAGVEVRFDNSHDHMHHKFAVFDRRRMVTGSYNWTRSAARNNLENIVVTDDPRLVTAFGDEFERLWELFDHGRS